MRTHTIQSAIGPCLIAVLVAPALASAHDNPGDSALRLLGVSPTSNFPRPAGTAILVAFEDKHYILTALHVVRTGGKLAVEAGPPGGKSPPIYYLEDLVNDTFRVDPATDVCAFCCTPAGFERLTSKASGKRPIPLNPVEVKAGWQVVALGNPNPDVIFPGAKGQLGFDVENVPGPGTVQSVQTAGDVFPEGVKGDARTTRLILIGHNNAIRQGFGGGPLIFSRAGGRDYELVGMVCGGDPISKNRAWAVTAGDLIKAIKSASVSHFPPDHWPEVMLPASVQPPQPPAGAAVDLPERVGSGPDRELIENLAERVTSTRDPSIPVDDGVLKAWRRRYEELSRKNERSPSEEYLFCLLARTLEAFGSVAADETTEARVAGYLVRLQAGLNEAGAKLWAAREELRRREEELRERGESLESLALVFLVEAEGAWRRRDLQAASVAFDRYLKLFRSPLRPCCGKRSSATRSSPTNWTGGAS